jgi:hypothetical protein
MDNKDIDSIIQQWELKKILMSISTQKQKILQNSFDENEKRYKARAEILLKDILYEIDTYPNKKKSSEFEDEIEDIFNEVSRMEKVRERAIKICIGGSYKKALYIKKRIVKGTFWDDTYFCVSINQATYTKGLKCFEEIYREIINHLKERLNNIENKYKISFRYPALDDEYLYEKSKEILIHSGDKKLDIFKGGLYKTDEYTNRNEAEENMKYYIQKADFAVDRKYTISTFLNDFIELNSKTIDQKKEC